MVHLCNSLRTLFIFSFFCIISPPQRLLHNNQRLTFYSWSATVKLSKLIFWLYLLCPSAPWVIWASPRTGVREISNATSKPSIRAQNRKVLCNIRAFRWWCADVSPFWGKRTESGHTHTLFALQHAQTMFSVRLPQMSYFCQQCRLNLVFSFGVRANMRRWHDCVIICFWVYVSVYVRDVKEMSRWRERKREGRRDGAGCTRRKLGLMLLHAAAPKHPHSSCWSVCMCVDFLCIDWVSYFNIRKEEPVSKESPDFCWLSTPLYRLSGLVVILISIHNVV